MMEIKMIYDDERGEYGEEMNKCEGEPV